MVLSPRVVMVGEWAGMEDGKHNGNLGGGGSLAKSLNPGDGNCELDPVNGQVC